MLSKLVAWAEDRPAALARMRRALDEYVVAGIRTTVPFFAWLLDQPAFVDGQVHTTFLDESLALRQGRPFVEPTPDLEEVAVMAAVLQPLLSPAGPKRRTARVRRPAGLRRRPLEGAGANRRPEGIVETCVTTLRRGDASGTSR